MISVRCLHWLWTAGLPGPNTCPPVNLCWRQGGRWICDQTLSVTKLNTKNKALFALSIGLYNTSYQKPNATNRMMENPGTSTISAWWKVDVLPLIHTTLRYWNFKYFYSIGALSTLNENRVKKKCPKRLRRVKYPDNQTDKTLNFLTNNEVISSQTVADRYRYWLEVGFFVKWIKQHLRLRYFLVHLKMRSRVKYGLLFQPKC